MRLIYGDKNILRILEEAEFWKRQESEHTTVIKQIVPDLEPYYVAKLDGSANIFYSTEGTLVRYIERVANSKVISPALEEEVRHLIKVTVCQSKMFVGLLEEILQQSAAVQDNLVAIVVINHIIRESQYYIGIAKAWLTQSNYN